MPNPIESNNEPQEGAANEEVTLQRKVIKESLPDISEEDVQKLEKFLQTPPEDLKTMLDIMTKNGLDQSAKAISTAMEIQDRIEELKGTERQSN